MTDGRSSLQALIEKYRVPEDSGNNRLKALIRELEALAALPVSPPVSGQVHRCELVEHTESPESGLRVDRALDQPASK